MLEARYYFNHISLQACMSIDILRFFTLMISQNTTVGILLVLEHCFYLLIVHGMAHHAAKTVH